MSEIVSKTILFVCMYFVLVNTEDSINEDHEVVMNAEYDFKLKWRIDGGDILLEISADTMGYVAIGFSPNGGMPGSDIVIGWVRNGQPYLSDRYATEYAKPEADTSQDYTLLYGREEGGRTTVGFRRALNTCDDKDNVINDDTLRVIWAVNNMDPVNSDDIIYHGTSRGVRSILLLSSQEADFDFPEEYNYFDGFMPNVTVPDDSDTTYLCFSLPVPKFDSPVHIFRAETIVQEGHESLVHHLLVYSCQGTTTNWTGDCYDSANMPTDLRDCDRLLYGWAVGAQPLNYPEHVGISLGKEGDPTVIFVQIHYDNPGLSPDFHDNSGVRFFYTPMLREYDAAVWEIGEAVTELQAIPANENLFKTFSFCYADCTREVLNEDIKIFFVFLHSHLAGRQMSLQHYRNGSLIDDMARDDNYDFNQQDTRVLRPERVFKPGDEFVLTCGYNTVGRDDITFGGLGTYDEMCLAYVFFYPKQANAGSCLSTPDVADVFTILNLGCVPGDDVCAYASLAQMDPVVLRDGLYNVANTANRNSYCRDPDFNPIPGVGLYKDFPAWFSVYDRIDDANDVCSSGTGTTMATGSSVSVIPAGLIVLLMFSLVTKLILRQ
ncbi:DBH-like monooxygenase protein 1 homolog [Antedon mediterranea]|uniref:DBH-like monooxygenase protein 1 homolog n=1 Tax=Antedon mediterranea TaxID=105859 RepID=UPI003AF8EC4A